MTGILQDVMPRQNFVSQSLQYLKIIVYQVFLPPALEVVMRFLN